ncbi:MAG TPA: hypothetical protein VEJ67_15370 [Candidatus Cybelea sp.]|nr:hypothetical protein [Candidatus Cybelea sp.]
MSGQRYGITLIDSGARAAPHALEGVRPGKTHSAQAKSGREKWG